MITAAIFDIDGTLLDSVDDHARAWQEAFAEFGHSIPFADVRYQIGKGSDQLLPVFLSDAEREETGDAIESLCGKLFKARYLPGLKPFPAAADLLRRVKAAGLKVALGSSAKAAELEIYKTIVGIEDLVDTAASSEDAERSKPHPDIFAAAMKRLGDPAAADVIALGDTPYDAQAAGKLGIRTIGMLCGGFPEADLREAGCIAIYRDPADLLARFDESPLVMPAE